MALLPNARGAAFEARYAAASELLRANSAARAELYAALLDGSGVVLGLADAELRAALGSHGPANGERSASSAEGSSAGDRVLEILRRAESLKRAVYDIYADERIADKAVEVNALVDRYLAEPELALAAVPKSMAITSDHPVAGAFRESFPSSSEFLWSTRWFELAVLEPLILYQTEAERERGIAATVERFQSMAAGASAPTHPPMVPTISPRFVNRHPRAAAVVDNLHMLEDLLADIAVSGSGSDLQTAVGNAVEHFRDPDHLAVEEIDWIWTSVRHGIYAQGGPAIGTLERPERNGGGHADHDGTHMPMPGM